MTYIDQLIAEVDLPIRTGHPTTYEALHVATGLIDVRSYLEIGVHDGASFLSVLKSAPNLSRVVLCDIVRRVRDIPQRVGYKGSLMFLHGDSYELIPTLAGTEPFDLILVDGDHSYLYAKADIENAFPLLCVGGLFAVDDSNWPEVARACEEFVAKGAVSELLYMYDELSSITVYRKEREC